MSHYYLIKYGNLLLCRAKILLSLNFANFSKCSGMAKDHPSSNVVTSLKEINVVVIVFVVDNEKHSKADAWTQLFIMSFGRSKST